MTLWLWVGGGLGVAVLLVEVGFRLYLKAKGKTFTPPKTHRNLYIVPHPYLPYVYKLNAIIDNSQVAPYPLHAGRFEFRSVRINNIRCMDRDVQLQKPPGTRRVMCLGSSSIASSIWEKGCPTQYSVPLCLKESLERYALDCPCEVLNCGMGGWTTAEIFINFALHLIDLRPDVVILYQGFTDLEPALTGPFASDYSHSRRNLGEVYARLRLATYVPNLGAWRSYFYLKRTLLGFGNIRYDLLRSVRLKKPDFSNPFMGVETERRNVEHLIHLCQANGIQIVLSTYAYHLYGAEGREPRMHKYQEGVGLENEVLRDLATRHQIPLVDIAALIPDDDAYFLDAVHFTPLGMQFLADQFAGRIAELLAAGPDRAERSPQGVVDVPR